jgi:hypothetical protein
LVVLIAQENDASTDIPVPIALPSKKWDDEDVDESNVKVSTLVAQGHHRGVNFNHEPIFRPLGRIPKRRNPRLRPLQRRKFPSGRRSLNGRQKNQLRRMSN